MEILELSKKEKKIWLNRSFSTENARCNVRINRHDGQIIAKTLKCVNLLPNVCQTEQLGWYIQTEGLPRVFIENFPLEFFCRNQFKHQSINLNHLRGILRNLPGWILFGSLGGILQNLWNFLLESSWMDSAAQVYLLVFPCPLFAWKNAPLIKFPLKSSPKNTDWRWPILNEYSPEISSMEFTWIYTSLGFMVAFQTLFGEIFHSPRRGFQKNFLGNSRQNIPKVALQKCLRNLRNNSSKLLNKSTLKKFIAVQI